MKLLCLSTAEQGCSLAVIDGDVLISEEFWTHPLTHSRRILKMVDHMLEKRACMTLDELDGFVASKGPGSFTGLRIGISVIKGFAQALDKPAAGVSSLDGIAYRFSYCSMPVGIMMDARRGEVYFAVYQFDQGRLISKSSEMVISPDKAVEMTKGTTLFAGSGSKVYSDMIEQKADKPIIVHNSLDHVTASAMVRCLFSKKDLFDDPDTVLIPSYIRQSDAQMKFRL